MTVATILIVDDEALNRKLLEAQLQADQYVTRSAASGEEALAAVALAPPDLILLDVMMPGMDGYQVARALKADPASSHIPIIMVTALTDHDARLAGLNAGVEEFVSKPVDRIELCLRVRNLLRLKALADFQKNHSLILEREVASRTADLRTFRLAMDATADAIMLVRRATMLFIEVNATACAMLDYSREELLRMGPTDLRGIDAAELADVYDALIGGASAPAFLETHLWRRDGSPIQVEIQRHAQWVDGDCIIVCGVRDIGARKEAEQRLHRLAHYDTLTGLPNRSQFYATLGKMLAQAGGARIAVLLIDLDHFKNVNETLGHGAGDVLLGQFSSRLVESVRLRESVGRLGGDEFGIILVLHEQQPGAAAHADAIRDMLRLPFDLGGQEVALSVSIGIAVSPDDSGDPDVLMKYADTAMHRAKRAGRDTYRFFTPQMDEEVRKRRELEGALRKAIDNEEFVLFYQPKVQLDTGRTVGAEALLRWRRPGVGMVSPLEFIPLLEETGLIGRVGSWVIMAACRQIGKWLRSSVGPMQVSVNVSGHQFGEGGLDRDVLRALNDNGVPADLLELELTESTLMANTEHTIATLRHVKRHGVQISIDDFGTGYSSLAYLRRFPIDKLKIDIAFVRDITSNPDDAAIALAIISMAHSLKLGVIAEGVETAEQLSCLRRQGCDQVQGYYFSAPLPADQFEQFLRKEAARPAPAAALAGPRRTLLLVDDEAHVLTALRRLLRQDGYQILAARSAAEGFALLALHPVHVILCDQRMPGMRGTVFLDRVKDMYPDTFRIVLSGYTDLESIMEAINRGAIYRFYTKPWDNKVLRENIREAFRHYALLHGLPPGQDDAPQPDALPAP
ncbi:EAL domain-containing protein [Janthinobacterium fluminis]|uniref:EAL domain-containing protein n=1 Tax=Janthinobacterium fluminis TaxID=2987524 RepID=A0ABT5JVX7_9BURK|nr:EAL domain-containing protein [Janthinobacterium fluminis]MDC8756887.1 EAL domain-containing protein [Janthinobacterium fluminis]